jgi:arylsulfatase A-like enzyme
MIVQDGWKLAAERQDDGLAPTLMTNLNRDPYEMSNMAEDPSCSELRSRMLSRLAAWDRDVRGKG